MSIRLQQYFFNIRLNIYSLKIFALSIESSDNEVQDWAMFNLALTLFMQEGNFPIGQKMREK